MVNERQIFDTISVAEFERLINLFIHREDPDALSFQALAEMIRERLSTATTTHVNVIDPIHERSTLEIEKRNEGLLSTTLKEECDDYQRS